jgi:hypothetical protein
MHLSLNAVRLIHALIVFQSFTIPEKHMMMVNYNLEWVIIP